MTRTLLVVEDDAALRGGIALALRGDDCSILQADCLAAARRCVAEQRPDLAILDINLPDGSGLDLLGELRSTLGIPVIMLSANDMETDIVTGLEMGADDYITKPFSLMVLRARVNARLRKLTDTKQSVWVQGGLRLDWERMEFTRDGAPLELSKTEQKLLRMLTDNAGMTLTRAQLVDRIWSDGADYVDENALSVTVKRLRDKLELSPSSPALIKTVYGIGYTWVNA